MQIPVVSYPDDRPSGLSAIGQVPWGTHLCQFYRDDRDLVDVVVPFLKAGLDANERCLWITAEPLDAAAAHVALAREVPDLSERVQRGQIEILDYREWYLRANGLRPDDVLRGWLAQEALARGCGYDGLRISGNLGWLQRAEWDAFVGYESCVHGAFRSQRIIALCSYSLQNCNANDVIDVLRNHGFALIRRDGRWERIRSATEMLASVQATAWSDHTVGTVQSAADTIVELFPNHTVRFFREPDYPVGEIAQYVQEGLAEGGALLFATQPHIDAVVAALRERAVDVDGLIARRRLVTRDAEAIAHALMRDNVPDADAFERMVAAEVHSVIDQFEQARAYGEIVNVLARRSAHSVALQIERWWNELLRDRPVALMCGYALANFANAGLVSKFRQVCAEHNHVRPVSGEPNRATAELEQATLALRAERHERRRAERAQNRLQRTAQSINTHLVSLQQLTSAMSEATTLTDIGRAVATGLSAVLGANAAGLALSLAQDGKLQLTGQAHMTEAQVQNLRVVLTDADSPLAAAYRARQAVWLYSAGEIAERYPALCNDFPDAQVVGCLPLILRDDVLGAVLLIYNTPYRKDAARRALLDDYVSQISLAVERARSYEEAEQARARLQLLADAGSRIAQAKLDLGQVMDAVTQEVTRAGFAHFCAVTLRENGADTLSLVALHHVDARQRKSLDRMLRTLPARMGQGIMGCVAETGKAVRLGTREEVLRRFMPAHQAYLRGCSPATLLAVPLRASGAIIGALVTSRDFPSIPFSADDEQLVQELADRAALSIDNALLYKRAQRERERAEAANRTKDEFLAMLGHEMRNPLSPILTAVHLMRLRGGELLAKERTIIERQVHHMVRLVDDLLDVSRITRGKIELRRAPIELVQVVANAVEIASPLLEERRHRLVTAVPNSGLVVNADAPRLAQVVANLLTNAAKYTPSGGTVEIKAWVEHGNAMLSVRDTGIGIEPELLPRIFDLFAQGAQGSDRAQGGLGLGLSIARNLTEMHNGKLRAMSEGRDTGAEFVLELPLVSPPPAHAVDTCPVVAPLTDPGRRILVVDDNSDAADSLREALQLLGHATHVAYDGPSALQAAEEVRPDLALLDIGLPVMDGYELGQRLRSRCGRHVKLVALTGYGQPSDRRRSADAGFDGHLVKPVDFERLQSLIKELFAS
ncbi:MAG: MEDS domain-containing protein [Sulfurifustaceae bacterium]